MYIHSISRISSNTLHPLVIQDLQNKSPTDNSQQLISSSSTTEKKFPIEILLCIGTHIKDEKTIEAWVLACIKLIPFSDKNNISFLKKNFYLLQKKFSTSLSKQTLTPISTHHTLITTFGLIKRQLPISLQQWVFSQSSDLRKLALIQPNSTLRIEDSMETVVARYINVLPSLQNTEEYKIALENLRECLSVDGTKLKTKNFVQNYLIKNLNFIPFILWPKVFCLFDFILEKNDISNQSSEENLSEEIHNWLKATPKKWLSTILLAIIEKCFDSDCTNTLPSQYILSILSSLKSQLQVKSMPTNDRIDSFVSEARSSLITKNDDMEIIESENTVISDLQLIHENYLSILLINLVCTSFPKLKINNFHVIEYATYETMLEVVLDFLKTGIDQLHQENIIPIITLMIKNLNNFPSPIQNKISNYIIQKWVTKNPNALLLPLIKEIDKFNWEKIILVRFFQYMKNNIIDNLSEKVMPQILIEIINHLKNFGMFYPIERSIFEIISTHLKNIPTDKKAPIIFALAKNIDSTYTTRSGVENILNEYLPNLTKQAQLSTQK